MEELDLGLHDRHPAEVLFEKEQEVQQGFTPDHYRVVLKQPHQTGKVAVARDRQLIIGGDWLRCVQQPQKNVIDLRVYVLGESLIQKCDEGLLNAGRSLGQCIAEEPWCDLVEDKWEELRLKTHNVRQSNRC